VVQKRETYVHQKLHYVKCKSGQWEDGDNDSLCVESYSLERHKVEIERQACVDYKGGDVANKHNRRLLKNCNLEPYGRGVQKGIGGW